MFAYPYKEVPLTDSPEQAQMLPSADAIRWFTTGPDPLVNDESLSVLIVQIGMAGNALSSQFRAGARARGQSSVTQEQDIFCALVTSAALTNEAIKVASRGLAVLRPLAVLAGAGSDLLEQIGKLCAGKHESASVLRRARNELGFHWDPEPIQTALRAFRNNRSLVWLESDREDNLVHRLAADVLAHGLFPEAAGLKDAERAREIALDELRNVDHAMTLIIEFFTACVYGYLSYCDATRQTISEPAS
jgi:hypothetical protein